VIDWRVVSVVVVPRPVVSTKEERVPIVVAAGTSMATVASASPSVTVNRTTANTKVSRVAFGVRSSSFHFRMYLKHALFELSDVAVLLNKLAK
jgi:hypothetical protein